MPKSNWLQSCSPAFRLMIATSWLAPDSWRTIQDKSIGETVGAGPDWTQYIHLVDRHRTSALSWTALSRVPTLSIPDHIGQELRKRDHDFRVEAIRQCRKLVSVLKAFNTSKIPVMPLKGPVLSSELYGDVGLRQSKDLDLWVKKDDVARARNCLSSLGWKLDADIERMTPRQWEKFEQMDDDLKFKAPQGDCELELHSRILWDSDEENIDRWAKSIPTIWQGCTYQSLDAIDQVLYLSTHGGSHGWYRAKWLGDLARILAAGQTDWESVLKRARGTYQEKPLLACLKLLHIVYELPLPQLPGNPWENLPPLLIDSPLRSLNIYKDPAEHGIAELMPDLHHMIRYQRMILPQKTWREILSDLFYCRQDFAMVSLPDSLFWAYAPLRPVLFLWRNLARIWKS